MDTYKLVRKPGGKRPLRTSRRKQDHIITMDLQKKKGGEKYGGRMWTGLFCEIWDSHVVDHEDVTSCTLENS
jgi:hypothetical protein